MTNTTIIWLVERKVARACLAACTAGVDSGNRSSMFERIRTPEPYQAHRPTTTAMIAKVCHGRSPVYRA